MSRFFPIAWMHAIGNCTAPVLYALLPGLRRNLLDNARHILGAEFEPRAGRALAVGVLRSFSRFVIEIFATDRRMPADARLFENMRGAEHFERAKAAGKGIIGVTLHIGNYEAGPLLLTKLHQPVSIVYHPDAVGVFESVRSTTRGDHAVGEISMGSSPFFGVTALEVLRQNGILLVAADLGTEFGAEVGTYPFFGADAPFLSWPAQLSQTSGAPLLPCFILRDDDHGYRLEIDAPVFPDPDAGVEGAMQCLVRTFERYVRRYPDQWMIVHRYWPAENGSARDGRAG